MIGLLVREPDPVRTLSLIREAEAAGVPAVWLTTVGTERDGLTLLAVAAGMTERVRLGTAIIPIWARQPVALVQEVQAIEARAPGRLLVGLGTGGSQQMADAFGAAWRRPLARLAEYVTVARTLLREGAVDFRGEFYAAKARIARPLTTPLLVSALGETAFRVAGRVSDGAIAWMAPWRYAEAVALPAIAAGAAEAGRETPPLYFHVPVCVEADRTAAYEAARSQVGVYFNIPSWAAMFAAAGHDPASGLTEAFFEDVVVHGGQETAVRGLRALSGRVPGDVIVHPVLTGDRDAAWRRVIEAVAAAN
ncbi:MAG TPA: LLM class flavin-dependent oxidoreductase [Dehalococcoidia bacterium]|nr:LLM class flavin-dependent oxidoreductase [Dehalococcoidia bacterium]